MRLLLDVDSVFAVGFGESDFDVFVRCDFHDFTHIVGLDRQFSASSIYEYCEFYLGWTAMAHQCVECGADGSTGLHDFVNQDDPFAVDVEWDFALVGIGISFFGIVSKGSDVEASTWHGGALDVGHGEGEAFGDVEAAIEDTNHDEILGAIVCFEDFVRHSSESSANVSGIEAWISHCGAL